MFATADRPAVARYAVAMVAVAVAALARHVLSPLWGPTALPFIFFFASVAVAAWYGRWGPGVLAIVLGGLAASVLFMEPLYALFWSAEDGVALLVYGTTSLLIVGAIETMHQANDQARESLAERERIERSLTEGAARQEALYRFVDHLHRARSLPDVYDAALDCVSSALRCDRASILVFDDGGVMRFVRWRGLSEAYRTATDGHSPWKPDAPNPEPVCIPDVARSDIDEALKDVVRREGIGALCFLPLVADGRLIGKFMAYYNAPRSLAKDEIEVAVSIGRQLAFGIARQSTERELREAGERMRSVVDHVVDGIITIDRRGNIQSYNRAAERIFGYSQAEVLDRNVRMLMPEPYHGEHDSYIGNYLRTGQARIIGIGREVVGRRRDGSTFPMELAVSEFRHGQREYFTGIVRDITDRKRLEDQLRQRVADLAQSDRQKNEFLAMLGHELRNPLAPMSNALYLMKDSRLDAATLEEARGIIERQLQHLVRLVDDLLDVSRIIRGRVELRRERIDLAQAIRRAVETARPVIDANGHELDVSLPDRPLCVMGDLVRLAQVVANLLTNAAKYSTRPGRIALTLEQEGDVAVIAVKDQGAGIPPELLPRVFELFVQGDHTLARSGGGLGIGLTLVQQLVQMHQGQVAAYSAGRDQGSEFIIRLPLLAHVEPPGESREAPRPAAVKGSRRVLIVDDNVDAANSLAIVLELLGHRVECAYDGPAALSAATTFHPEAIVLDIGLPGMDGYEVARRLRATTDFAATPIIAVTGYGQQDDRQRTREAGFDHHLTKPIDADVLNRLLGDRQSAAAA